MSEAYPSGPDAGTPPRQAWDLAPSRNRLQFRTLAGQLLVGAAVSFAVIAVIYGPNNAVMGVALIVVCTAGIGLIPLLFVSWLVGWIVFAVRRTLRGSPDRSGSEA